LPLAPSSPAGWLLSRFIFAMKFSRNGARNRTVRVSFPGQMFGLHAYAPAARNSKLPKSKLQKTFNSEGHSLAFGTWRLAFPHCQRCLSRAFAEMNPRLAYAVPIK
jgi:hypothetical protein